MRDFAPAPAAAAPRPSIAECHAAGMSLTSAVRASHRGPLTCKAWAVAAGVVWPQSKHYRKPEEVVVQLPPLAAVDVDAVACRALWLTLIGDQLFCATQRFNHNGKERARAARQERDGARAWFGSDDFAVVCDLAGVEPAPILRLYRARLAASQGVQFARVVSLPRRADVSEYLEGAA